MVVVAFVLLNVLVACVVVAAVAAAVASTWRSRHEEPDSGVEALARW